MKNESTIECPNCSSQINVNEIIYVKLEEKIKQEHYLEKKKLDEEIKQKREEYALHFTNLKKKEEELFKEKETFEESVKKATKEQLVLEKQKLNDEIRKEILDEQNEAMTILQKELELKSSQVKELNTAKTQLSLLRQEKDELESKIKTNAEIKYKRQLEEEKQKILESQDKEKNEALSIQKEQFIKLEEQTKAKFLKETSLQLEHLKKELDEKSSQVLELNKNKFELEKIKREKDELESKIKADAEIKLNEQLKIEKEKIKKISDEENELKFKQKEEQLKQLQEQLSIAQRKAEQGSMQLQGEVQELAIEEYLGTNFPLDLIEEIKKGARGGDCIQVINTRNYLNCGKIYYESKRTKDFQKSWIEKFKGDMRDKGVDIGVLITEVLPKELTRMGLYEGIWICTYEEFKGLCSVLRESLINIHFAKKSQEDKTDKMSLLYSYLTSKEFSMNVEAIVEGFVTMQSDLDSEKRSMNRIWKQREKQIQKVLDNTIAMYGSIKGIAGNEIANFKALELEYIGVE